MELAFRYLSAGPACHLPSGYPLGYVLARSITQRGEMLHGYSKKVKQIIGEELPWPATSQAIQEFFSATSKTAPAVDRP